MRQMKREERLGTNVFPRHCIQVEILQANLETTGFTLWQVSPRGQPGQTPTRSQEENMKEFRFTSPAKVKLGRLTVLGAVLAAFVCLASTARADSTNGYFWYQALGPYTTLDTLPAPTVAPASPATATFIASNPGELFNFQLTGSGVSGDVNLAGFLGYGGDTITYPTLSSAAAATDNINNGVFEFTGYTTLVAGQNYEFTHDDGMMLYLTDSNGVVTTAINSANATSADTSSFHVSATGTYYYEVLYAEVNGGPAVLTSNIVSSATPEPSSLLFMGTGLLGLALLVFWRGKAPRLVLHS
jgi:hypothetical protein